MDQQERDGRRRFDELVSWYVTGELSADDRQWIDAWLASHPDAMATVAWHQSLAVTVSDSGAALPGDAGWDALAARLAAERAPKAQAPGLVERLRQWFGTVVAAPGFALAAAVIVAQAVVIGALVQRDHDAGDYSAVRGGAAAVETLLRVRFSGTAAEQDLRVLLNAAGGRIVDGPDQLGEYLVAPRQGDVAALRDALQASGLVAAVELHERRGARAPK